MSILKESLSRSYRLRRITATAIFISLSITLRLFKHVLVGGFQFINFPLIFALVCGYFHGFLGGFLTGLFSFALSDCFLGFGPWTLVDGFIAGCLGALWSIFRKINDKFLIFFLSFISIFIYDIFTSTLLYVWIGFPFWKAFIIGFIGLFLPVFGGYIYAIGPITEFLSSMLICILIPKLNNIFRGDLVWR